MKTFKILNHTLSFDEGFIDYLEIMQEGQNYKLNFDNRYWTKPQKNITTLEEFGLYVQELYNNNGFAEEYMKLSEEIVKLYIKYGIYDMPKEMIQARNLSSLNAHLQKLDPIIEEITIFISQVQQGVVDIEAKWQDIVNDAVSGHYFNMYSSSYTDLLLNDYFNHKEEKRVERKRERLYNENASKTVNDYLSQVIPLCKEYINNIQQMIYEDVIEAINTTYKNFALDLVARGKISAFSQYTDSFKSSAILDNINKITSKEVIVEQLVNVLQIDPLNPDIHFKIIDYITDNDIPEYVELIKFIKLENLIFYIYANDFSKGKECNKCLTILKAVKDTLNIESILRQITSFNYTDDVFMENIKAIKIYFNCLKNILGEDNKLINEKEQDVFMTAIKEASKGTNLVYDGSITRLDYNYLCEFWEKARKQRNSTIKRQEITQNVSNSFINWVKNHIKLIIIIIIIIAIFHWISKDTNNTNDTNKQVVDYDTYVQNKFNPNFNKNTQVVEDKKDDTYITEEDLQKYKQTTDYVPGKSNPFSSYE